MSKLRRIWASIILSSICVLIRYAQNDLNAIELQQQRSDPHMHAFLQQNVSVLRLKPVFASYQHQREDTGTYRLAFIAPHCPDS